MPIGICECCHGIIYNKRGNVDKRLPKNKVKRTLYCINCAQFIMILRNRIKASYQQKYKKVEL